MYNLCGNCNFFARISAPQSTCGSYNFSTPNYNCNYCGQNMIQSTPFFQNIAPNNCNTCCCGYGSCASNSWSIKPCYILCQNTNWQNRNYSQTIRTNNFPNVVGLNNN